jgi:SAM-dependent methyltransferase
MTSASASQPAQNNILPCPVCGGAGKFAHVCRDADLYRCPTCDHCFSDPMSIRHLEKYGPEYYEKNWFQHANMELFGALGRMISTFKADASVADIGCGDGAFLKYLRRTCPNFTLVGVDLSSNEPYEGIEFVQGDVLAFDITRRFDVVVSLATIEHIVDVQTFVGRVKRLCQPGGLVITMTLNDRSILYASARLLKRFGFAGPCNQLYSGHHLNHFNTASLRKLLELNGLTVRQVLLHNIPLAAVDVVTASPLSAFIQRCGVFGTFQLGKLARRTYLQTVICSNGIRTS